MKLVIIYGPPSVGKLTVGKALAEATGFKLLHNHLVSDLVLSVFQRHTSIAMNLNAQIKNLIFETAAINKQKGIITTFLYDENKKNHIDNWCKDCIELMDEYKVPVYLVRLSCDIETLKLRVVNPSRIGTRKITSAQELVRVINEENSFGEIPETIAKSLHIENTDIDPARVARIIKEYYEL